MKTVNEFYCPLGLSMVVSEDGQWVAGIQVTEEQQFQLVKENFATSKYVEFKYIHESPAETIVLHEDQKIVMTGGLDKMTVIYDWVTGEVIKVLDIIVGPISCLFRIGSLLVISENHRLRFVDSANDIEVRMKLPVESHCKFVSCMDIGHLKGPKEAQPEEVIIFGGTDSAKLNVYLIQEDLKGGLTRLWPARRQDPKPAIPKRATQNGERQAQEPI